MQQHSEGALAQPLKEPQEQPEAVAAGLRSAAESDREFLDKGIRAFVSYVRAYREHQCRQAISTWPVADGGGSHARCTCVHACCAACSPHGSLFDMAVHGPLRAANLGSRTSHQGDQIHMIASNICTARCHDPSCRRTLPFPRPAPQMQW